ncbi:MAG: energy transducer TonB [Puniceicoccaceae bacterium]
MKTIFTLLIATLTLGALHLNASDAHDSALSIKDVDTAPVPVQQAAPTLTDDIKGISGMVHVSFVIGADGSVVEPNVLKTTDERLNASALQTVSKWAFKAAENNGTQVAVRAVVPIRFK